MKINNLFSFIFVLTAAAELAIGRIYDERLSFLGFNLSILLSFVFLLFSIIFIFSTKKIILDKSKILLISFFLVLLIMNPILWTVYGAFEYGVIKFFNFVLISIPLSFIIIEKLKYDDIKNLFYILLGLSFLLLFLAITGLFDTPRADGRISILGGGPIIFGRWMGFGVLALFFLPIQKKITIRIIMISAFIIYCLISGSRGPFTALLICFLLFFFLNFRKVFFKSIILFFVISCVFIATNISNDISELGRTDRVFLNVAKKGGSNQSTQTRYELIERSLDLMIRYPLGIGAGNWQIKANEYSPTHLMAHEYPHNLIFEVINEYGIFAGLLLILFILKISFTSFAKMINYKNKKSSLYPFLFYLWCFLIVNAMVSGSLNDSRLLLVVASCVMIHKPLLLKLDE